MPMACSMRCGSKTCGPPGCMPAQPLINAAAKSMNTVENARDEILCMGFLRYRDDTPRKYSENPAWRGAGSVPARLWIRIDEGAAFEFVGAVDEVDQPD